MRPALEVADIFRHHGPAYIQAHGGHLGRVERRVISAIELCRTSALGGHVEGCRACGTVHVAYNSCRNRHCPKCQSAAARDWLAARADDLLPVPYFHVVFTLPAEIAAIAFQNKAVVYGILFKSAAETLRIIAADPRHLGAGIGLIAVLHSWGQTLSYHPHLHCIVPGGGPSPDGTRWIACRPNFFLPVRVLSRLYRRLFLQALRAAFDAGQRRPGRSAGLRPASHRSQSSRLGCLRQAALRRAGTGAGLSEPVHPSCRYCQFPSGQRGERQGDVPLARLPTWSQAEAHDAGCR
jgi:hypothetical protein